MNRLIKIVVFLVGCTLFTSCSDALFEPQRVLAQDEAATKIQSLYRGHKARKDLTKANAATKIQSLYRGHKARKDLTANAATKIQSLYRGHKARKDFQKKKEIEGKATRIQSLFRSYKVQKTPFEKFEILEKLGSGAFAEAYKAQLTTLLKRKLKRKVFAAKRGKENRLLEKEASSYQKLKSSQDKYPTGLVDYHGVRDHESNFYILLELMDHDLNEAFEEKSWGQYWSERNSRDLIEALDFLHRHGISSCDLKPDNIVAKGERLKLIDFGSREGTNRVFYNWDLPLDQESDEFYDRIALGTMLLLMKNANICKSLEEADNTFPYLSTWLQFDGEHDGLQLFVENMKTLSSIGQQGNFNSDLLINIEYISTIECVCYLLKNHYAAFSESLFSLTDEITEDISEKIQLHVEKIEKLLTGTKFSSEEVQKGLGTFFTLVQRGCNSLKLLGQPPLKKTDSKERVKRVLFLIIFEEMKGQIREKNVKTPFKSQFLIGLVYISKGLQSWDEWDEWEKQYLDMILNPPKS